MIAEHPGLRPLKLAGLSLKNRVIKSATYEGMSPGGRVSDDLIAHHARMARGGVALTTVAYAAVSPAGRTFDQQLLLSPDRSLGFRRLTDAVHREGCAASIQLAHCGGFSSVRGPEGAVPGGPSPGWNRYGASSGLLRVRAMSAGSIREAVEAFASAARLARDCGFDAVELHLGHGYLLSQFLSPATNRRTDDYGGDGPRRLRAPLEVIRAVRDAVGPSFPILVKTNLSDGFPGGLQLEESIAIHRALQDEGVDAAVLSGGDVSRTPFFLLRGKTPAGEMARLEPRLLQKLAIRLFAPLVLREWPFTELFFRPDALRIRAAVSMPLVLLGGVVTAANVATAMHDGFELVALGRALLADPDFVVRMEQGEDVRSRCTHCNLCVAAMNTGGVRCHL